MRTTLASLSCRRPAFTRLVATARGLAMFIAFGAATFGAQVTLTWQDNSSNEAGFRIERKDGTGAFVEIAHALVNATSYTDTGLDPATQYAYRIRAYNVSGNSSYSNTLSVSVPSITTIANQTIAEDSATGALMFTVGDLETDAATLTVSAASSNTALVPSANAIVGGAGASRTVTVTPLANQSGVATITLTVSDGTLTNSTSFSVTVNAVNDAPTASAITDRSINEDATTGAVAFTVADIDSNVASLAFSGVSSDTTLVPNTNITFGGSGANRTVTVAPAANLSGSATITVTVSDGSASATTSFLLTVAAINDAPTISTIPVQTTLEDTPTGSLSFTVADLETSTAALTVTGSSTNTSLVPLANVVISGTGASRSVVVTPALNKSGSTVITLTVGDGTTTTFTTFQLGVTAVNDAPSIVGLANRTINEDGTTGSIALTLFDVDSVGTLSVSGGSSSNTTLVPNGNIVFGGSGANPTITVTPAANQNGTATITVTATDGTTTGSGSFVLTVNAVNDSPTIGTVAAQGTSEDVASGPIAFTIADPDVDAATLTVTGSSSNQTLLPNASIVLGGSGENRTVTLTPALNQSGTANVTLQVSDGTVSASRTFAFNVTAVNDAPTVSSVASQTISQNTTVGPLGMTIGDVESSAASLTIAGSSSNATLVPNENITFGGSGANRTVSVAPVAGQTGVTTITLAVSDGAATTNVAFAVTVVAVNSAPTISAIADQTIAEDASITNLAFTIGDFESASGGLNLTVASSNTTLVPNASIVLGGSDANRTISLTPALNQSGTATITVTVSDGALDATETFLVTVSAMNDAPTISSVGNQSTLTNIATGALAFTVSDVETAAAGLVVTASSSNLTVVPNGNIVVGGGGSSRTVTVTPALNQAGTATITLTVDDGTATTTTSFTLTVLANTAPTITSIGNQSTLTGVATGAIGFTIGDFESPVTALTVTGTSSNTTLVPDANIVIAGAGATRTVVVTPAAGENGSATVTLTVNDGLAATPTTFVITVAPNTAPTIGTISSSSVFINQSAGPLSVTIADAETSATALVLTGTSSDQALVPNANISFGGSGINRTVTVSPTSGNVGAATITVTVSDGTDTTSTSFTVTVSPLPDIEPSFTRHPQGQTVKAGSKVTFTVTASGDPSPSLQWEKDGVALTGATGSSLVLDAVTTAASGRYTVVATNRAGSATSNAATLVVATLPLITLQPQSGEFSLGASVTLTVAGTGTPTPTVQWQKNGVAINGATGTTFAWSDFKISEVGSYSAVFTNLAGSVTSELAAVTVQTPTKVTGAAEEIRSDVVHPNGNIYDQVLLKGRTAVIKADAAQVTRLSFIDLNDDIVQVELSGAGTLSLSLEASSGPTLPANYNQAVEYMKGHASVLVTGTNETSNITVFSVGKANAVDQSLFRDGVGYDGVADIASISIVSATGKFGGLRAGNVNFFAASGTTGLNAADIEFAGPVFIGDINGSDNATAMLVIGKGSDVRITGGNLAQPNGRAVQVRGLTQLQFVAGVTSHGASLPAQPNQARLEEDGVDVTAQIVVNP